MKNIIEGKMDLDALSELSRPPELFEPGDGDIWTDEHISKHMLDTHLDPYSEGASRRHESIKISCDWISERLDLKAGSKVLDLGCGPGLYCREFAEKGMVVTGMDYSPRSIGYARENKGDREKYILGNYISDEIPGKFDVVLMIYYDFGVLSDEQRDLVLSRINSFLDDHGYLVFDVLTPQHEDAGEERTAWSANPSGGFWSPKGYMELFRRYYYKEEKVKLDQHTILDSEGNAILYRIWHRFFTPRKITDLLKKHGFVVEDYYSDLEGGVYNSKSGSLGIVAKKG